MAKPLRALLVEDNEDDTALLLRELRRGGITPISERVETRQAMAAALQQQWDVVISDWYMPRFSAEQALALLKELELDLPFIIVSGTVTEEVAVAAMHGGAHDFMSKRRLTRLIPAIEREMREAAMRAERRHAEQRVREQMEHAEALLEAMPDPVVIVDSTGRIARVNARTEAVFGYARAQLLRQPVEMLIPERLHAAHAAQRAPYQKAPTTRQMGAGRNLVARRSNGEEFAVDVSLSPVSTPEGPLIISTVRDVTERKQAEAQLYQSQKMEAIGNLTGGMAHDFNNLLGVVIGNLDLLRELREDDPEVSELTDDALDAALRGADLTRRLLGFARQQPLQPRRVDVNELASSITKLLRRTLGENIEVALDLATDLWGTVVDPAQLEASLVNLATNSRDAMPNGGRLRIATANRHLDADYAAHHQDVVAGDYVLIEVSDTGTGMPPGSSPVSSSPSLRQRSAAKVPGSASPWSSGS